MSHLLPHLVVIAEKHLPQLEHDIDNASTLYTLQAAVKQLHQYVTYIIHHQIADAYAEIAASMPKGPPAPPPAVAQPQAPSTPVQRPVAQQQIHAASSVPALTLPRLSGPGPGPVASANPGTAAPGGAKVLDVSITPAGTHVQIPGGPSMTLPPGTPVTDIDVNPQPVLNGPGDVVLPPGGGGMTPDVEAALAAATGARNITADQAPGQK